MPCRIGSKYNQISRTEKNFKRGNKQVLLKITLRPLIHSDKRLLFADFAGSLQQLAKMLEDCSIRMALPGIARLSNEILSKIIVK